jgi:adenine-specific DNA-methyltransferase
MVESQATANSLSRVRERVGVRARELRRSSPDAERASWQRLRNPRRTEALSRLGFHVMRFDNRQALAETDAVLTQILHWLESHHPHPNPLPQAGEGATSKD